MTSFIGDILCKIEESGRLLFPSNFKKQLEKDQNTFILKKDIFDKCLVLYTTEEWDKQINIIRLKLNTYNKEHNQFLRDFFKNTAEINLDSNNRMIIPKRLLEQIEAKKEIYLVGVDTRIEIWAKEVYESSSTDEQEFANLAQKLLGNINLND